MRLSIDHRTTYRFTVPQGRLVQLLRMTPRNTHDQTVAEWHVSVDCDVRLREHQDGFGNTTTMLYAEGPIDGIEIAVSGEVVTSASRGVLSGSFEPLPPAVFLRTTSLTEADAALIDFARSTTGDQTSIAALHALNGALAARFTADERRPEAGLSASAAFARSTSTPRDLTQMFVAAARAIGVP